MSTGGIDTSMYAPPAHQSPAAGANEFATLMNTVTSNKLLQTSIQQNQLALRMEQINGFRNRMASLAAKESVSRADLAAVLQEQVALGLGDRKQAAILMNEAPEDEEGLRDWAKQQAFVLADVGTKLGLLYKQIEENVGPGTIRTTQDMFTGQTGPQTYTPHSMSVDQQIAQQPMVDDEGRGITISGAERTRRQGMPNLLEGPAGVVPLAETGVLPGGGVGGAGAPSGDDGGVGPGGAPTAEPAAIIEPPPGSGELTTSLAPGDAEIIAAWNAAAAEAADFNIRTLPLDKALKIIDKLPEGSTGPGTETINDLKQFLTVAGEQLDQQMGTDAFDPAALEAVSDFQELRKYLNDYTTRRASSLGATNAQLAAVAGASPNVGLSGAAIEDVLKTNLALERMQQMKVLDFRELLRTGAATKADWQEFSLDWNKSHEVGMYAFDLMTPEQQDRIAEKLAENPKKRSAYQQAMEAATDAGIMFTRD